MSGYRYSKVNLPGQNRRIGESSYRVYDSDGHIFCLVRKRRRESWLTLPSGIRYHFRGYSTTWEAEPLECHSRTCSILGYTRKSAVENFVQRRNANGGS